MALKSKREDGRGHWPAGKHRSTLTAAERAPKTAAERKRAERARRRRDGLVRVEGWVHPDDAPKVRAFIDRANKRRAQ